MSEWLHTISSIAMLLSVAMIFTGLVRAFGGGIEPVPDERSAAVPSPELPSAPARKRGWLPSPAASVVIGSLIFVVSMMTLSSIR